MCTECNISQSTTSGMDVNEIGYGGDVELYVCELSLLSQLFSLSSGGNALYRLKCGCEVSNNRRTENPVPIPRSGSKRTEWLATIELLTTVHWFGEYPIAINVRKEL